MDAVNTIIRSLDYIMKNITSDLNIYFCLYLWFSNQIVVAVEGSPFSSVFNRRENSKMYLRYEVKLKKCKYIYVAT